MVDLLALQGTLKGKPYVLITKIDLITLIVYNKIQTSYEREKIVFDRLQREKYSTDHANCTLTLRFKQIQNELDNLKQEGAKKHSSSVDPVLPQHASMLEDRKNKLTDKIMSLKTQNTELAARSRKLETETKKIKSSFEDQNLELENLKKKYKQEVALRTNNDKIHIQHKNELQQVIKEKEDMSRNFEATLHLSKTETEEKDKEKAELIKDKGKLEKEIDTLKLRLLEEGPDMTLNQHSQVTKESIKRAQVLVHYEDFLQQKKSQISFLSHVEMDNTVTVVIVHGFFTESSDLIRSGTCGVSLNNYCTTQTIFFLQICRGDVAECPSMSEWLSHKLGSKMKQLYEHEWKEAMKELESEDDKINIEFLLKILERAYSFSEHMVPRFAEGLKAALLSVSNDIEIFLRDPDSKQYETKGLAVHTYIREAVAICWLMVIQKPRVFISTAMPNKSQSESFDPYNKSKSELIDYVVWPVVKLSNNEGQVICNGIAEFK
ncbi:unnamed protein product [Mytilus coruscus]|uniref:Mitochondria-eating protein C-terminal domain-containing protein n=1 Tax=Mytilus coruscus TaxID=42192 RepID=A0A6J8E8T7_MYTCO|nr:unnamed protein product [Mytilus coruscus]